MFWPQSRYMHLHMFRSGLGAGWSMQDSLLARAAAKGLTTSPPPEQANTARTEGWIMVPPAPWTNSVPERRNGAARGMREALGCARRERGLRLRLPWSSPAATGDGGGRHWFLDGAAPRGR